MVGRIEKTVFISYRRSGGSGWALAVSQYLAAHGFDVFLDYRGIASGDFEQAIIANIKARAHFIVLLTPFALDGISNPGDWLRREIETAVDHRRNVVPLRLEGFDFSSPSIKRQLTGFLPRLMNYNALTVPVEYFEAAMDTLRTKYLNVPIDAVLHPPPLSAVRFAKEEQRAVEAAGRALEEIRAAASGSAVIVFALQGNLNAEQEFLNARRTRWNDYFATRTKKGPWRIHRLHCSSLAFDGEQQLTASPKIVASSESEIREWAQRFGVGIIGCSRCRKPREGPSV